jgi:hypothetical protein
VSFPLHADFYADFGLLGLVIGMLALGFVFRICDQAIFRSLATFDNAAYIRMIARVELSIMCIYLLRGNFLSALAFTTAVATSLLIIHFLVSRRVVFRFPGVRAGERRGKREVGVEN